MRTRMNPLSLADAGLNTLFTTRVTTIWIILRIKKPRASRKSAGRCLRVTDSKGTLKLFYNSIFRKKIFNRKFLNTSDISTYTI